MPRPKTTKTSGFECMECGHKFRTIKAAERALLNSQGCPNCGGANIDLSTARSAS